MKYSETFVAGGFPYHTYNPRTALNLESQLFQVKENLCKLVAVTGQTKSGKTVLVRRILPPEDVVWIDGGTIGQESDFWETVLQQLDLYQVQSTETQDSEGKESQTTVAAEGSMVVASAKTEHSETDNRSSTSAKSVTRTTSAQVAAFDGLRKLRVPVIIDDFHYLPRDLQATVVRALKPLVFEGLPVVAVAIPHRRYDAVKVEKEMTARFVPIQIPNWSTDELLYIPATGFSLLNCNLDRTTLQRMTEEAIGSPHLMQDFCRSIARTYCPETLKEKTSISVPNDILESVFRDLAESIGKPIFEKLAKGPRSRADRIRRVLKSGQEVDIYQLVLHALAHLRPQLVSLEYEEIRSAIRTISESGIPQLHEVARVLKHMSTIASSDQASTPVIDFDEEEKKLHVTDPYFAFYLRWGSLA